MITVSAVRKFTELAFDADHTNWSRDNLVLLRAIENLMDTEQELVRLTDSVEHIVVRARDAVQRGMHVNSQGELQQTAASFDRACVLREERVDNLLSMASAFGYLALVKRLVNGELG